MSSLDRDYQRIGDDSGRGGGLRRALGRIFGDGENPLGWSLPIGSIAGIRIKLHLFLLLYIAGQMVSSISQDRMGAAYMALSMTALFLLVLLHEFGHCFACRRVGGEADEVLLWPLGGLASVSPPHTWRANLITTLGGPAVNAVLLPVFAGLLALAGHADTILFNPLKPSLTIGQLPSWWLVALWWLHYTNLVLLLFNMLVPMFPLDAGRALHALLWHRVGARRATETATLVGLVTAGALAVGAMVLENVTLIVIAVFGAIMCWRERQLLRVDALAGAGFAPTIDDHDFAPPRGPGRAELKRREKEAREQAEVDRILAKIAQSGMASLSRSEKKALQQATERKRRG